jgi:hypothetical protein
MSFSNSSVSILDADPIPTPANDPIIAIMLSRRQSTNDMTPEQDQELQNRLYTMLRYSKNYKRLQVAHANQKWLSHLSGSDVTAPIASDNVKAVDLSMKSPASEIISAPYDSGVDMSCMNGSQLSATPLEPPKKRDRRISFSDKIEFLEIESPDEEPTKLVDKLVNLKPIL